MASKEATVYIVDVGSSMGEKRNGRDVTDLDWALEYVWDRVTSTVATDRKTAHVGVVGLKTDGTENDMDDEEAYRHISVLRGLGQMLMPDLRDLKTKLKASNTDSGDAISALAIAIGMIVAHCKKLQYIRRIILITNGLSPVDADGVEQFVDKIKSDHIELVVLGVDFDDPDYGFKEEDKPGEKAVVEQTLKDIVDQCDGVFGTLAQAIDELGVPRIKTVRPTHSYKGYLTLGDPEKYDSAMAIDVERYPKVMVAKAPSASSFVIRGDMETQTADGQGPQDDLAAVKRASTYQVPDESAPGGKKDVEQDELAKGYAYGSTAVYISESDRNVTTFETRAGLDIIGFIDKNKYQHYMDMSRSNVIIAQRSNDKAGMALSSFIHALYELESYAVARFVAKPDKAPQLLLLCPSIEPDVECLYDVELPYAEDFRQYRFPPLDRIVTVSGKVLTSHRNLPSQDLQTAMSAYVDSMDLSTAGDSGTEYAIIDEAFSPMLHRVNQVVRHRAIHPSSPLPAVPQALTRFSQPPPELLAQAQPDLDALIAAADVKRVPPKAFSKRGRANKRDAPKPLSGLDVASLLSDPDTKKRRATIDSANAVPEFKQAVAAAENEGDADALGDAFAQMGRIIREMVATSTGEQKYAVALEAAGVLRQEALDLEMPAKWNEWAVAFKRDILDEKLGGDRREAWFLFRRSRIGLIEAKECAGGVTEDEAVKWKRPGMS